MLDPQASKTTVISSLASNIWFWIALFFLIRMVGITNPPLETTHSWRQVTGLMVARNFVETDANILYPRVDDTGARSGITGMEFPLQNYLIYLWSLLFGYSHWAGRLINLIISSLGIYFFFLIIERFFNKRMALYSSLVLISSIWFMFSRKVMPDTFCISLMLAGVWFGLRYLTDGKAQNLILYTLLAAAGILSKIPAGIYLAIFAIPFFSKNISIRRKAIWLVPSILIMAAMYWWYFIWNVHLSATYGNWYNSGESFTEGAEELSNNLGTALERFYFSALTSFIFLAVFIIGLVLIIVKKKRLLIMSFLLLTGMFLIYILKSGYYFHHHNYYIIPFVPIMAMICGYALSQLKREWLIATILFLGITESLLNQYHDFFIDPSEEYKLKLEAIADEVSDPNDLIIINGGINPQQLYLAHRKGWNIGDNALRNEEYIKTAKAEGAKYIFVNKHTFQEELNYPKIYSGEDYDVYSLY